jgi:hypothetical protein
LFHVKCILVAGVQENDERIVLLGGVVTFGKMHDESPLFVVHRDLFLGHLSVDGGEHDRGNEDGDEEKNGFGSGHS